MNAERRVFTKFHREVCCWIDKWYGLTMEDIRRIEDETKRILVEVSTVHRFHSVVSHIIVEEPCSMFHGTLSVYPSLCSNGMTHNALLEATLKLEMRDSVSRE